MRLIKRGLILLLVLCFSFSQSVQLAVAVDEAVGTEIGSTATSTTETSPAPATVGPQGSTGTQGPTGTQGTVGNVDPATLQTNTTNAVIDTSNDNSATAPASTGDTSDTGSTSATNSQTGADSENNATVNQDTSVTVDQTNTANTTNNITGNVNTGDNAASFNTGNGTTDSGDINGQLTVVNVSNAQANNGSTIAAQSYAGNQSQPINVANNQTGARSLNDAAVNQDSTVRVNILNDATTVNNALINANTGNNSANFNTGNGTANSGDVNLALTFISLLNELDPNTPIDVSVVNVMGDLINDFIFPALAANNRTGSGSQNLSTIDANHDLTVTTANNAEIINSVAYDLNTGNNRADFNTGGGSATAGSVNAQTAITNIANAPANMLYLVNVYGQCDCDLSALDPSKYILNIIPDGIAASNTETGADSENNATVDSQSDTNINQTNNGSVTNNIRVNANTGNNSANFNTGSGSASSGDINVATTIANLVNTTVQAGERFMLGVINILGNWTGKAKIASQPKPTTNSTSNNNSSGAQTNTSQSQQQPPTTTTAATAQQDSDNNTIATASSLTPPPPTANNNANANKPIVHLTVTEPVKKLAMETGRNLRQTFARTSDSTTTSNDTDTATADNNNVTTADFTVMPSPVAKIKHHFAEIANAAQTNGIIGSQRLNIFAILLIPLGIWAVSEFAFGAIMRRRKSADNT